MADDEEVVRFLLYPVTLGQKLQVDFSVSGRFRPLYYALRFAEFRVFGTNPLIWHLFMFGVSVLTLVLLYHLLRQFVPLIYALFGMLIPLFYYDSIAIWYRLGTQETIGVLLILLALIAFAHHHDTLFVISILIAAAYKESFTLLIPAMLALYILVRKRWVSPQTFALVAFGAVFGAVVLLLKVGKHGLSGAPEAASNHSIALDALMHLVTLTVLPTAGLTALLLASIVSSRRERLGTVLVLALWIVPQCILYSAGMLERYQWPAILIYVLIVPVALFRLRVRRGLQRLALILLLLVAPVNLFNVFVQTTFAQGYYEMNHNYQTVLLEVARENPPSVYFDYARDDQIEWRYSTRTYLRFYGYRGRIEFGCAEGRYCLSDTVPGVVGD